MSEQTETFTLNIMMSSVTQSDYPGTGVSNHVSHTSTYDHPVVWPELLKRFLNLCEQYGFRIPDEFTVDYNTGTSKIDVTFDTDVFFPDKQTISA
jgi:hypothetical protein